jgi:hypothetical protein
MNFVNETESENLHRASEFYQKVELNFNVPNTGWHFERHPAAPGDRPYVNLWPYTGLVGALNALAAQPGQKEKYENDLRRSLQEFDDYYDPQGRPAGYDSYIRSQGGGQKYYDDNEWVGLEFVRAYQLLGDQVYLDKAKEAFAFAVSGWNEAMGGGIYWRQGDDNTKNTCSNAPAAVLAAQLYQLTGEKTYLDWALKILDWLKVLRPPDGGAFWDNISKNGHIDPSTYTYNTGTALHAYALLYAATGQAEYLDESRSLAKASLQEFAPKSREDQTHLFPASPWFNAILLRGYLALYQVDPDKDDTYLDAMRSYLDFAWQHARGKDGMLSPDPRGSGDNNRWILDQAGWIEMYALLK